MATKIIVTNKTALETKYGIDGTISILGSLNMMVAMDRQIRNISSFVLLLDNKEQMAVYRAANVTDPQDEKQVKNAIDKVCTYLRPDYILLLGGCDIIPHQHLVHPVDASRQIESDLPYACSTSYGTSVDGFLQPGRKVSRLPDATGKKEGADAQTYVRVITNACKQKTRDKREYADYFAVTAQDFEQSRRKRVAEWFGNSDKLVCCPPHGSVWNQEQYDCLFHYFALYGMSGQYQWFDDKEGNNAVYECANDRLYINAGTIVVSQCSYGAQLFEAVRRKPMCNVYMENGAGAFLGCTGECSQSTGSGREDVLVKAFLAEVRNGKTVSEAFLSARNQVIKDVGNPTAEEKLILAQWVLLGDGSCQLISLEESMENKTITKLKELGIYEHVLRHRAICVDGEKAGEEERILPSLPAEELSVFAPDNEKLKENYIFVYPTQIGEIKALTGVAERTAVANDRTADQEHIRRIKPRDLSDLNALAYRYLILSETEMEKILADAEYSLDDVKKHILNTAQILPVLCAGGTLEVGDGKVVKIQNTAVAVFENVIIHGSGTIEADSNTKIVITNRLEHV